MVAAVSGSGKSDLDLSGSFVFPLRSRFASGRLVGWTNRRASQPGYPAVICAFYSRKKPADEDEPSRQARRNHRGLKSEGDHAPPHRLNHGVGIWEFRRPTCVSRWGDLGGAWPRGVYIRFSVRKPSKVSPVSSISSVRAHSKRRRARMGASSTSTLSALLKAL